MNKFNIIPSIYRNKLGIEVDPQIQIDLSSTSKDLVEYDKSSTIDLRDLYVSEKNKSFKIRPVFNVGYVYNNIYSGSTSSKYKDDLIYPLQSSLNVQIEGTEKGLLQSYEFDIFRATKPNSFGYESVSAYTYNWGAYITYPYKEDYEKDLSIIIKNKEINWTVKDGIPFITEHVIINGFNLVRIICGLYHNLNENESILLKIDGVEKLYKVYSFGDNSFNSEKNIVNIFNTANEIPSNVVGTLKRVIIDNNALETTSTYYIRQHKIIEGGDKVIITKSGFQVGILDGKNVDSYYKKKFSPLKKSSNFSYNFSVENEIDIEGLLDNKKRPITEIFLTMVFKGYSGFFANRGESMKQGWSFNIREGVDSWWDKSNPKSNSNVLPSSYFDAQNKEFFYYKHPSEFDGDFCEYNQYDQQERVVSEFHYKLKHSSNIFKLDKFNNDKYGYYYKPHNKMVLKVFSNYIETTNSSLSVENLPNYAFYSKFDGGYRWRDIYNVGFFDETSNGVNYPFINNTFYPFTNSLFKLFPDVGGYDFFNDSMNIGSDTIIKPIIDECE